MNILVSGSTGFIGSALVSFLTERGQTVTRLVRRRGAFAEKQVLWDPDAEAIDAQELSGTEFVVHLAGENISAGRWTAARKARIRDSRIKGTRLLCEALARLDPPPRALASASATGYYGDRGGEILREDSAPGSDFLAETVRQWEAATAPATQGQIRVVNLRFGLVLGPNGGVLARMLPVFRLGAGGKLGSGNQYMSWISVDDVVEAINHVLVTEGLEGPLNVAAPGVVTNAEFTTALGRVLSRPTLFPVPVFALRLAFGKELADSVLASTRMESARLRDAGFVFLHPELESALGAVLGKARSR